MYNSETELIFPLRVASSLATLRGKEWAELVEKITSPEVERRDQLAFVYMMVRLGGCVTCNVDSFRAMKGCAQCARQTLRRFRGNDTDLLIQFANAQKEVATYISQFDSAVN